MKVFLSWSGQESRAAATALRTWLPTVLPGWTAWMSSADIPEGSRWLDELNRQLDEADIGIVCVTQENRQAEWLLYEAGALGKRFPGARVFPVLIGVPTEDLPGPLAQFQAVRWSEEGFVRLVECLNELAGRDRLRSSELMKRLADSPMPSGLKETRSKPGRGKGKGAPKEPKSAPAKALVLDELALRILDMAAAAPEERGYEWIDADDLVSELSIPLKKAEFYMRRLQDARLLSRDGEITHRGTEELVRRGRL